MKIGYVRVSTEEQNTDRQDEMMESLGVERIYIDKLSGKDLDRPQLKEMLEFVREGDIVIVESFSRLSRSVRDLWDIVEKLESKHVALKSLKENIDNSTPTGRLFMNMCASFSQYEREINHQRTMEGVKIAKKKGLYKGRKPIDKPLKFDAVVRRWRNKEITTIQASKELNVSRGTFYNMLKRYKA